jgi:cell wall-associated NlpC family hydrolase
VITGQDIVNDAREMLGVRWHHQGRNEYGIDCIGLAIYIAKKRGLSDYDETGYGRLPESKRLWLALNAQMDRVKEMQPGDLLLMRFEIEPQHVAFYTGDSIIHALTQARKVVEHPLDQLWLSRVVAIFRFRGLSNG